MTEAARTEIDIAEDVVFPAPDGEEGTPFSEFSRLMVVGISVKDNNNLVWKAQTSPNGPWGQDWHTINDQSYGVLGGGSTTDGRVAIVAQTENDRSVHYITENEKNIGQIQRWNPPFDLGMPEGLAGFIQLEMIRDAGGRVEIFGVDDSGGNVWWIYQNPPRIVDKTEQVVPPGQTEPITVHVKVEEPPLKPWSRWIPLAGETVSSISVASNADGRILLLATGQDPRARQLFRNEQQDVTTLEPTQWTGWIRMDDAASGSAGSIPVAVLDTQGSVNVFMIGQNTNVVQTFQSPPGSDTWAPWSIPGMIATVQINVISGIDGDGHLSLLSLDENLHLSANQQIDAASQQWNGWQGIGKAPDFGALAVDYNADGRLSFFRGGGRSNSVTFISQVALDSTSWDAGWTSLAADGISRYAVVRDLTPPKS